MGYGYAGTFLVVFLTHPGVISIGTLKDVIPSSPTTDALWQVLMAWILDLPAQKSDAFGWTMYVIYIVFLFVYMYYFLRQRMLQGT